MLYADFSGGIDIVIGTAEIFGIRMDENFRQPFFSKSIGEFWRRWHITLGTWMKDYIFYPFSLSKQMNRFGKWSKKHLGNTVGKAMPICLADLLIFFVVGIWHGAAWKYIAYGMYNGIIIAVSSLLEPLYAKGFEKTKIHKESKAWTVVQIIRTFILVNIGWYFDMAVSFSAALVMMKETFTKMSMSQFTGTAFLELGMGRRDFLIVLAESAGTKLPVCAISTISAVCLIYVDLPAILGPVIIVTLFDELSRYVSLDINISLVIIFSTTGCRPFLISIIPLSLILGFT